MSATLRILRDDNPRGYTAISNWLLRESPLTPAARWALAWSLSHVNNFEVFLDFDEFFSLSCPSEGRDSRQSMRRELVRAGFWRIDKVRDASGVYVREEWHITDDPEVAAARRAEAGFPAEVVVPTRRTPAKLAAAAAARDAAYAAAVAGVRAARAASRADCDVTTYPQPEEASCLLSPQTVEPSPGHSGHSPAEVADQETVEPFLVPPAQTEIENAFGLLSPETVQPPPARPAAALPTKKPTEEEDQGELGDGGEIHSRGEDPHANAAAGNPWHDPRVAPHAQAAREVYDDAHAKVPPDKALTAADRSKVGLAIAARLADGWLPSSIAGRLTGKIEGARSVYAVWMAVLADMGTPQSRTAASGAPRPRNGATTPWCGRCSDPHGRWVTSPETGFAVHPRAHCPACSLEVAAA